MTGYYFLVCLGYVSLTVAVGVFEARRIRATGPDTISVFIVLFVVQCCLPGVVIYACLPLVDRSSPTDVAPFDRIFAAANLPAALLVLGLTAWFVFFFYVLGSSMIERFTKLILYRAGDKDLQGSLLNAYGFALTQTWAWLSVLALFVIYERHGRRLAWFLCLV